MNINYLGRNLKIKDASLENSFQIPGWIPVMVAVGMFIYQTLDAIDGKQARRTGSSNALGELFDHGCDSISNRKNSFSIVYFCSQFWLCYHISSYPLDQN